MKRVAIVFLAASSAAFGAVTASAGDSWPAIPPEVWAMKEDPATGTAGAVVLERRIVFQTNRVQYTLRVRVLSEQGRAAVELPPFTDSAYAFDGRTVHRDGTSVVFSEKKDFQTVTVKSRFGAGTVARLVPPGVNGDCVVELRWHESAQDSLGPMPSEYGYFHQWVLGGRYRTLVSVIDLGPAFAWAYEIAGVDAHKPEVKGHVYTIHNLPAVEPAPMTLDGLRGLPRFTVFWQPEALQPYVKEGGAAYWNAVGRLVYKDFLGKVSKGSEYESFAREILAGLPEPPRRRALALRERLDARIANTGLLTEAEKARRSAKESHEIIDPRDLSAAVRRGSTTGFGMFLLYLNLARDVGLKPTVALVANREQRLFRAEMLAPFQFDDYLVGVSEPGAPTLWLDPSMRFGSGTLLPAYQGTSALELDLEAWTLKPVSIPPQPPAYNVRRYTYELTLGEESDHLSVRAEFNGYPDWAERWRFLKLEPAEQARKLEDELESEITGADVTTARVDNAQAANENVAWTAEGRIEVAPERRRTVKPFPAMRWPFWIASSELAATRTVPIVLPYLQIHAAKSTVRFPAGYRLITGAPVQHANSIGSVSLSIKETPSAAEAVLRVDVNKLFLSPEAYGDFKDFLSWLQDACGRGFILERVR
jgi:hypothetical protein